MQLGPTIESKIGRIRGRLVATNFEVSSVPGGVQESLDLAALQTLFVREHNIKWIGYRREHPNRTVDQLYQQAKAIFSSRRTLPARHIMHIVEDLRNF